MKFFTRELYEFYQQFENPSDIRTKTWDDAMHAKEAHMRAIRVRLQESMRRFIEVSFHDGTITGYKVHSRGELVLEIDSRYCPWGPRGLCNLSFSGVKAVEGLDECTDASWLYEEVHLHPEAGFDFQVLLEKVNHEASENETVIIERIDLRIVADEVEVQMKEPSPRPIVGVNIPFLVDGGMYVWGDLEETGMGGRWYYMKDDVTEERVPTSEIMAEIRRFARGIGAIVAGE